MNMFFILHLYSSYLWDGTAPRIGVVLRRGEMGVLKSSETPKMMATTPSDILVYGPKDRKMWMCWK